MYSGPDGGNLLVKGDSILNKIRSHNHGIIEDFSLYWRHDFEIVKDLGHSLYVNP